MPSPLTAPSAVANQTGLRSRRIGPPRRSSRCGARPFSWLPLALAFCVCGLASVAADKSGVSPNTISLPKGPGSIEGLGESFQPTLNTGTAKYGIAINVPPGTAAHAPDLRLTYEGGGGNGIAGFGWQLSMPLIQRRTDKGIPTYGEDMGFPRNDSFINDLKEELVPGADGFYRCKNEGPFIRYRFVPSDAEPATLHTFQGHWEATLPNGTRLEFGLTEAGRIQESAPRIFAWLLERETDTRGNVVLYSYRAYPDDADLHQRYLVGVRYGPGAPPWPNYHFARFVYEPRSDWFEDCRSGFPVRTGRRLKQIIIGTQGPALAGHAQGDFDGDGVTDSLVRRYDLEYAQYAGSNSHGSLLGAVALVGADGVSALPPSTFGYAACEPPADVSAADHVVSSLNEPPQLMDNENVEFVDMNGDGLPDVLRTLPNGLPPQAFLNLGPVEQDGATYLSWTNAGTMNGDARVAGYPLSLPSVHLADLDGDGLADWISQPNTATLFFFRNQANLSWGNRRTFEFTDIAPPSPYGNPNVRTADLDFDKQIDIIQSSDTDRYFVWHRLSTNQYAARRTRTNPLGALFSSPSVQIADFNGDRLSDVAQIRPSSVFVAAGLGYGRFAAPVAVGIDELLTSGQIERAKLQDITGDGLADLVIERAAGNVLWYWVNRGNYQFSPRRTIRGLPTPASGTVLRWADLNGNGSTDLIYAGGFPTDRLRMVDLGVLLCGSPAPNVLTSITNGIGRVTRIGYAPSTRFALEDAAAGRPWPDPMPFPVQVVAAVTNLDSLGHTYVSRFRYHDGYYDPVEKQFRGFARVEQVDVGDVTAPTLVTRSHFDTGRDFEAMKGRLLRLTSEQEDGKVFVDETTQWTVPPVTLYTGVDGTPVHFAHPTNSVKMLRELDQGIARRLESDFAYDPYGNQTLDADFGIVIDGDRSAFDDERIVTTEYAVNTNAWILRAPKRTEVKDEHGAVLSRTELFYDDPTFSGNNLGLVTIGNLTLKREWTNAAAPVGFIASARTQYDAYGNPTRILDPLAVATGGAVAFSKGHGRQIAFDPRFQTYPITETIHLGDGSEPLVFQAAYDEGFGTVVSSTDFNGNSTTYGYDTFARLTSIVKPGDTPAYPTVEYDYALAIPFGRTNLVNYVETRQLDKTPGTAAAKRDHYFLSRQFVDGLGRKLLAKTEAEPEAGSTATRVVVTEATQFNARQKPARTLNPFFSLAGGSLDDQLAFESIEAPGWTGSFQLNGTLVALDLPGAHATRGDYDATLRPTQTTNPDGTFRRTVYEPLVTRSFDENDVDAESAYHDTPMVHHNDGLGRLVRVDEIARLDDEGHPIADLRVWTTRYQYDLNDQLTRITDSQNNIKTFTYDGLKRKTGMNDPDRGVMTFTYDDASNLVETTDAKSQRITYTYDGANRILTENYHDGRTPPPWRNSPVAGGVGRLNHEGHEEHEGPKPLGTREPQAQSSPHQVPLRVLRDLRGENPPPPASTTDFVDVLYHYDRPIPNLPQGDNTTATARNVKGVLAWVEDLSGEEHTSYDARGRVDWVAKRIPDPLIAKPTSLITYGTRFEYDSLDRLTRLTYPDNDEIGYAYNARSLLEKIVGGGPSGLTASGCILTNLAYWPSAQQQRIDYGNGIRTTYTHDSRLRLTEIFTRRQQDASELVHFGYDFDGVSNIRQITDRRPGTGVPEGDPRRNTQIFQYDDLYRLTQAKYSFNLPGQPVRNDGLIDYRYDRIGNMLAQTSSFTNHLEKGLPVADLGDMDSGGATGRWNRSGRAANEEAGPHALTAIRHSQFPVRHYPYDANGNMTDIDGLKCTWDFKDRLIGVENAEMRAEYTYDYTDRRITKRVGWKAGAPDPDVPDNTLRAPRFITVSYPNKYFEVREHDAPTKYVWNGNTRVARVTGSLTTNVRVQRLRVYPGWNLCSLAVAASASDLLSAIGDRQPSYRWNQAEQAWLPLSSANPLPAGTVLWLKASTNATLTVTGTYSDPTARTVPAGGDFLPSAGLEDWDLKAAISNLTAATAWTYDPFSARWLSWLPPPLELTSDLPPFIAPGEAVFVRADIPIPIEAHESGLRLRYYHQDHLKSLYVLSDAGGANLVDAIRYPFGELRSRHYNGSLLEAYGFGQKELDSESGYRYVEARFVGGIISRFLSTDPLALSVPHDWIHHPISLHPYSFGLNNPIRIVDPTGLAPRDFQIVAERFLELSMTKEAGGAPVGKFLEDFAQSQFVAAMNIAEQGGTGSQLVRASGYILIGSAITMYNKLVVSGKEENLRQGFYGASDGERLNAAKNLLIDQFGWKSFASGVKLHAVTKFRSVAETKPSLLNPGRRWLGEVAKWMKGDRAKVSSRVREALTDVKNLEDSFDLLDKITTWRETTVDNQLKEGRR